MFKSFFTVRNHNLWIIFKLALSEIIVLYQHLIIQKSKLLQWFLNNKVSCTSFQKQFFIHRIILSDRLTIPAVN